MFKKELPAAPRTKLRASVLRGLRQTILETYPLLTPHLDAILPKKSSLEAVKLPERATLYVAEGGEPVFFETGKLLSETSSMVLPHLRLVHRFPHAFPTIRIDRGAIRFVLSGATLMAPGVTSAGGRLPIERAFVPPQTAQGETAQGETSQGETQTAQGETQTAPGEDPSEEAKAEDDDTTPPFVPTEGVDDDGHWTRELAKGEPVVVMAEGKAEACAVGVLVAGTKEVKEKGKGPVMESTHYLGDGLWTIPL